MPRWLHIPAGKHVVNERSLGLLHQSLPYDAVHDLAPVALFGGEPSLLLAAPGKNFSSVDDLVAAAKANPGKLGFASVGIGSASHFAGERFRLVAEIDVQHIAYGGPVEALNDLTAGRIHFYFVPTPPAIAWPRKARRCARSTRPCIGGRYRPRRLPKLAIRFPHFSHGAGFRHRRRHHAQ